MAVGTTPLRPHRIIRAVELVHDCLTRQAIDATPIENLTNIVEQDDGGIFVLVLAGEDDGSLSRPRCPSSARRVGNGDEGTPVISLAIAQLSRQWRVQIKVSFSRPGENHTLSDIEVGFGVGVVLVEPCQLAPAIAPRHVDHDRAVHDRQRQRADGGHRDR